eukprot:156575-Chlamydomonas_euryale.AAC.9
MVPVGGPGLCQQTGWDCAFGSFAGCGSGQLGLRPWRTGCDSDSMSHLRAHLPRQLLVQLREAEVVADLRTLTLHAAARSWGSAPFMTLPNHHTVTRSHCHTATVTPSHLPHAQAL